MREGQQLLVKRASVPAAGGIHRPRDESWIRPEKSICSIRFKKDAGQPPGEKRGSYIQRKDNVNVDVYEPKEGNPGRAIGKNFHLFYNRGHNDQKG